MSWVNFTSFQLNSATTPTDYLVGYIGSREQRYPLYTLKNGLSVGEWPCDNLYVRCDANIDGNTTIVGNLTVLGDYSVIDTYVTVYSALSVFHNGPGPAVVIEQNDNISDPALTIFGNISGRNNLSGNGGYFKEIYVGPISAIPVEYVVNVTGGLSASGDFIANSSTLYGNLSVTGNTILGSDNSDIVTINAGPVKLINATATADALEFGSGANLANLYRSANDTLKTDDNFEIGINGGKTTLNLSDTTNNVGLTIGGDTNLYREAANALKTDDTLTVGANLQVNGNTTLGSDGSDEVTVNAGPVKLINSTTAADALEFGSTDSANLYRSDANTLKTDDSFIVDTNLTVNGNTTLGNANTDTVTINGNLSSQNNITGNAGTFYDFTLNNNLTVNGNTTLGNADSDTLTIHGNISASDDYTGNKITVQNELVVNGNTTLGSDSSDEVTVNAGPVKLINATAAADALEFGSGANLANLYRSANDTLRTDDSLIVNTNLTVNGNTTLGNADSDTLTIHGNISASDDYTGNKITVQNELVVNGDVTLGDTNADTVTINAGPVKLINATAAADALEFGSGANLANLYRSANDTLKTDDNLIVDLNLSVNGNTTLGNADSDTLTIHGNISASDDYTGNKITIQNELVVNGDVTLGDTNADTVTINAGPVKLINATAAADALEFGSGANLANLYRSANDTLRTDDSLIVNTNLTVNGNTTLGDLGTDTLTINGNISAGNDYTGNKITVQNELVVNGDITLGDSSADTLTVNAGPVRLINATAAADALEFGPNDANKAILYKSATNVLKTEDNFEIAFNGGKTTLNLSDTTSDVGLTIGGDTNLYRSAANVLKTDDTFTSTSNISAQAFYNTTGLMTVSSIEFQVPGSYSLTIPLATNGIDPLFRYIKMVAVGGGGGGGGGYKGNANNTKYGGAGGGAGNYSDLIMPAAFLPSTTLSILVGSGANGGGGQTGASGSGESGGRGSVSRVTAGATVLVNSDGGFGGQGGLAGTSAPVGGAAAGDPTATLTTAISTSQSVSTPGVYGGSSSDPSHALNSSNGAGGGGAGGGASSTGASLSRGSAGGVGSYAFITSQRSVFGQLSSFNGGNGFTPTQQVWNVLCGGGGGGGAAGNFNTPNDLAKVGNGGNGGFPGGGGGGGGTNGGGTTGTAASNGGDGGAGGHGLVRLLFYN